MRQTYSFTDIMTAVDNLFGVGITTNTARPMDAETKTLTWELPGVKREEIDISYSDNVLRIKVNTKKHYINDGFRAPEDFYDIDKIEAKYQDGLLEITVPKREEKKSEAKKIEIK